MREHTLGIARRAGGIAHGSRGILIELGPLVAFWFASNEPFGKTAFCIFSYFILYAALTQG